MEKSTGFSQSAYGLMQFTEGRGGDEKHPHILYTRACTHTRTHKFVPLNVSVARVQMYAVAKEQFLGRLNQHQAARMGTSVRVCAQVTSVPSKVSLALPSRGHMSRVHPCANMELP